MTRIINRSVLVFSYKTDSLRACTSLESSEASVGTRNEGHFPARTYQLRSRVHVPTVMDSPAKRLPKWYKKPQLSATRIVKKATREGA